MSGVRLVGALGRHPTYVSAGESHAQERQWQARRSAGVGAGGNRVRFHENPEDTSRAGEVGAEASGAAPKGQGKTQRDLILDAVVALKTLLGQGVGTPPTGCSP